MSDDLTNLNEQFIGFYRRHVLGVFRFHMVRSGDWQDAEAMTAETFRKAREWFDNPLDASKEANIWLFRTAVSLYARFRRPQGFTQSDDLRVGPTQEQLSLFARTTELNEQWRRLPRKEQDARALYLFGGLDLPDVAKIIGWRLQETVDKIGGLAVDQGELRLLAEQLQPVGYFTGHLENELRIHSEALEGKHSKLNLVRWMWIRYRIGRGLTLVGQVLPLLLLGGLLLWVVNDFSRQTISAEVQEEPTVTTRRTRPTNQARVNFPPSEDSAILASAQGGIFVYNLANSSLSRMIRVSEDGFFSSGSINSDFPPQVSPDGVWLSVVRPKDGSTWLFTLNGTERRQISASSLHLTWAPGGGEAVYPLPDDPRVLYQYSSAAIYNRELARFPGDIKAVAWSPDSRLIGVVYETNGSSPDQVRTHLALLPSRGGARVVLATQEEYGYELSNDPVSYKRLLWSDDSSELWYPPWNAAVNVDQALASELSVDQSSLAEGQILNAPLMPLIAQPFSNRYGMQNQLLNGPDSYIAQGLLRNVVLSPDRRQIALLLANPNGVVGSVAVQESADFEQRWIRNIGQVGKISWTSEGGSLLAAENVDRPGRLLRINTRNGRSYEIGESYWLLGTVSEMRLESSNRAPQTVKIPLNGPDMSGPTVRVEHSGLGISMEIPAHFRVWQNSVTDPNGSMMITNFDLGDPLGFVSLNADDFMIEVGRVGTSGMDIRSNLDAMVLVNPEEYQLRSFLIGDRQAYQLTVHPKIGQTHEVVYIQDPKGPITLYYLPADSSKNQLFDRILNSLQLSAPNEPTSTPQPDIQRTPTVEVAWIGYKSLGMGLGFDVPSTYLDDQVCGLRETELLVQVGSKVYIRTDHWSGRGLADYVDDRLANSDEELHISKRENSSILGSEMVTLEGSIGMSGFFSRTYIRSGERVWVISLSPSPSCDQTIGAVSDLEVYRRVVASLRVLQ